MVDSITYKINNHLELKIVHGKFSKDIYLVIDGKETAEVIPNSDDFCSLFIDAIGGSNATE